MCTTRAAALLPSFSQTPMKGSRRRTTLPLLRRRRPIILTCKKSEEEDVVVVVSGALGFIGSHCVEHLLRERPLIRDIDDVLVVGIDATSTQLGPCPMEHKKANLKRLMLLSSSSNKKSDDDDDDAKFVFVEGYLSLSAMDAMEKQLKNVIFDDDDGKKKKKKRRRKRRIGVVHCAGQSGVHATLDDPMGAFRANVETTATMIELAKRLRGNFVLLSSGATYGDGAGKMVASKEEEGVMGDDDGKSSMPTSPYAFSKIACEAVVRSYGRAFEEMEKKITISRIFTCFGNRGRPDMAISRFMRTLLSNGDESEKKLTMFGDGEDTWRDYCHVSDVCSGIEKALWREKGSTCETVNISRGEAVTLGRLVSAVQKAASDELKSSTSDDAVVIEKLPKRPGDVGGTFADVTKAKLLLDFEAKISLEDGIASVAKWYNSDEAKQYT